MGNFAEVIQLMCSVGNLCRLDKSCLASLAHKEISASDAQTLHVSLDIPPVKFSIA